MADFDLDAIAAWGVHGVHLNIAERDALVAAVRWAQDAPHHAACGSNDPWLNGDNCTCGRDEALRPFGGDRG